VAELLFQKSPAKGLERAMLKTGGAEDGWCYLTFLALPERRLLEQP
jgi:hypothetical protein